MTQQYRNGKIFRNYINGQWGAALSGAVTHDTNPADTRQELGTFPSATRADAQNAMAAAERCKNMRCVSNQHSVASRRKRSSMCYNARLEEKAQCVRTSNGSPN